MSDLKVLKVLFGDLRIVNLRREDYLPGGLLGCAEHTNLGPPIDGPDGGADTKPSFDRDQIAELCATIDGHNHAWAIGSQELESSPRGPLGGPRS